jgi:hypothetical protein
VLLGLLLGSPLRAFISPDPEGHVASMDLYSYCNGDPVNGYDPDGRVSTGVLTGQSYNAASSVGSALGSSGIFGEARALYQISTGVNQATSLIENKAGFPSGSLNALPFALGPEAAPMSAALAGIRYLGAAAEGLADFRALFANAGLVIPAGYRGGPAAMWIGENIAAKTPSTALSTFRYTTEGETFYHFGYAEHAAEFEGGLRPNGFASTVSDLTGTEAKAGLALRHADPPNAVYTITPAPGTLIRVNPVAEPLFGQPGGLPEFQFPFGTGPGTVSSPAPIR